MPGQPRDESAEVIVGLIFKKLETVGGSKERHPFPIQTDEINLENAVRAQARVPIRACGLRRPPGGEDRR